MISFDLVRWAEAVQLLAPRSSATKETQLVNIR
jgi:hypothetical protein